MTLGKQRIAVLALAAVVVVAACSVASVVIATGHGDAGSLGQVIALAVVVVTSLVNYQQSLANKEHITSVAGTINGGLVPAINAALGQAQQLTALVDAVRAIGESTVPTTAQLVDLKTVTDHINDAVILRDRIAADTSQIDHADINVTHGNITAGPVGPAASVPGV